MASPSASQPEALDADAAQQPTINTPFPNPPEFWSAFTTANLSAYQALDAEASASALPDPPSLPPELVNLRPPTPPADGECRNFGEGASIEPPVPPLPPHIPNLLPSHLSQPTPGHLLNLTRSLLLSFVELLHILSTDPSPEFFGPKWEDMMQLFKNAHWVLNCYRPWQAREALVGVLEGMVQKARGEIEGVNRLEGRVKEVLGGLGREVLGEDVDDVMEGVEEEGVNGINETAAEGTEEMEEERMMWEIFREEFGR